MGVDISLRTLAEWGATIVEKFSEFWNWSGQSVFGVSLFTVLLGGALTVYVGRVIFKFMNIEFPI